MKKVALITGASRGIGYALTQKMLNQNYVVIGASRDGKIKGVEHDNFHTVALDLSKPKSIENAIKTIFSKFEQIDVLINNAGIGPDLDKDLPEKISFEKTFQVNVTGTVFFTEAIIDRITENGMLLNISSEMGSISRCERSDSVAYQMSKSALNMYTKILANRLKNKIQLASIHPGWVKTTIAKDNVVNGRITPEQSADSIYNFITKGFETGIFWDAETNKELPW